MTHFSILAGFDIRGLKLHQHCTHYQIKAIIVVDEDLYYESNISMLAATNTQGVVEINFQKFGNVPILLLELTLLEEYDMQMHQKEIAYFHAESQFQFLTGAQQVVFTHKRGEIVAQLAVSELQFDAITSLPFVELNIQDFRLPICGMLFSGHLALEIQTDQFKLVKFVGTMQADLSDVVIPFQPEFMLKLIFLMNVYGTQHSFVICNAKVQNSQTLIKGALVEITEIDAKLDPQVLCLIDHLISLIQAGKDELRDTQGMKIKLSGLMNPYFLQRFVLQKNPKLVEANMPRFANLPVLTSVSDKKLERIYDAEVAVCQNIAEGADAYKTFSVSGSIMFGIETFPFMQKRQQEVFRDLCANEKSVAVAAIKINPFKDDFGFVLLSNKQIDISKCFQQFEVGTGNLAFCNPQESKQYLQFMHRGNYNQTVKLLANSSKSLVSAVAKGLTLHVFSYEMSVPFCYESANFSKDMIESAIKNQMSTLSQKIGASTWLRLYVEDLIYCEKHGVGPVTMPDDSFEQGNTNLEESSEDVTNVRASVSSKVSFVSRVYNDKKFDHMRWIDYFGQKTKNTQFCNVGGKYCKTLREFIKDEEERREEEEEERREKEERERLEAEEKAREEAERLQREEEERRIMEEARLEAERIEKEQEEAAIEEAKRQEEERLRQMEQIKLLQIRAQRGPSHAHNKAKRRKTGAVRRQSQQINFQIDEELIELKLNHRKEMETRSQKIQEMIHKNESRLRQLELEFQRETMTIQAEIEEAKMLQMNAVTRLETLQEENSQDEEELEREEEDFLLEQIRIREEIEKEHSQRLLELEQKFQEDLENDQKMLLERKVKKQQYLLEEQQKEEEFQKSVERRYEDDEKRYMRLSHRVRSENAERAEEREEWQPLTEQEFHDE